MIGDNNYYKVLIVDPSFLREYFLIGLSSILVGLNSIYFLLASSYGYILKHLRKGIARSLAWFT
jgi:hypothetical protein